jgi:hypothetical protein
MIVTINSTDRLIFVVKTGCVLCEVEIELSFTPLSLCLQANVEMVPELRVSVAVLPI